MEEVIISLPSRILSTLPAEVRTIALPPRTAKKAIPPAAAKTIERIDLTKNSGLVDRQPKTVK